MFCTCVCVFLCHKIAPGFGFLFPTSRAAKLTEGGDRRKTSMRYDDDDVIDTLSVVKKRNKEKK